MLSGLSLSLWLRGQRGQGRSEEQITKYLVRRGLFLFGAGLAFACLVWLPDEIFDWDILTLLGASTLVLAAVRRLPPRVLAGFCLLVLLASPPLRQLSHYASYWDDARVRLRVHAERRAPGISAERLFSLLPWIIFPVAGYVLGETILDERRQVDWPPGRCPRCASVCWRSAG